MILPVVFLFLSALIVPAQSGVDWERGRGRQIPADAIPAGNQGDAKITYICRVIYYGSRFTGKLIEDRCYYNSNDREKSSGTYDVLVGTGFFWKGSGVDYDRAVISGGDDSENSYVCRVSSGGEVFPGYLRDNRCMYAKDGRGLSSRSFEVLQTRQPANTLLTAAVNGNFREVRAALSDGQAINQTDSSGRTALMLAAEKGHDEIVRELIYERATIDLRDNAGNSALLLAAANGRRDSVRYLIEAGANVHTANEDGETAFLLAASNGHSRIVGEFLSEDSYGGISLFEMEQAFRAAAFRGFRDVLEILLIAQVDIDSRDSDGRTALMLAASAGGSDTARFLLDRGADVRASDAREATALVYAVGADSESTLRIIIETARLDKDDPQVERGFLSAALWDKRDALKFLLSFGVDINTAGRSGGNTALILAAGEGHEKMTEMLIRAGADLNARNDAGETATMIAAAKSKNNTLKELVKAGADLTLRDAGGRTALGLAILNQHKDTRKTLEKAGARQ